MLLRGIVQPAASEGRKGCVDIAGRTRNGIEKEYVRVIVCDVSS